VQGGRARKLIEDLPKVTIASTKMGVLLIKFKKPVITLKRASELI